MMMYGRQTVLWLLLAPLLLAILLTAQGCADRDSESRSKDAVSKETDSYAESPVSPMNGSEQPVSRETMEANALPGEIPSESVADHTDAASGQNGGPENVEELPPPVSLEQRFSYTYGYLLMAAAMRDVQSLDPVYFTRGVLDSGLGETPFIPEDSMNFVLFEYQDKLITEAAKRLEELAEKNLEDAESFLAVNGKREGVLTTESGLQYEILESTEGPRPEATDTVQVNYRLTYLDGREGDASVKGIPSTFDLSSMIPGFREGLMLMPVGSNFRFFVHPDLGYGETGSTKIEPNTLLIFDVELVSIVE